MSGLVLHPGHDELHGDTVVITGTSGRTYVGRWHEKGARGVTMRDAAIHDPATNPMPLESWIAKQRKFGIAATEKMIVIPNQEAGAPELFDKA